jgi:hypothetical protein
MDQRLSNRRRAPRFPIQASVLVRKNNGDILAAEAVNISSSGMSLRTEQPDCLVLGENVIVEIDLPDHPDKTLPAWGVGRVVRVGEHGTAIHLQAGSFREPLASEADGPQ